MQLLGSVCESIRIAASETKRIANDEYQKIEEERRLAQPDDHIPEGKEEEIDSGAGLPPDLSPNKHVILETPEPPRSPQAFFVQQKFNELSSVVQELATRQMPLHGDNINPLSPDVTVRSKASTEAAETEIEQIANEKLPDEFVVQNFAGVQTRPRSSSESKEDGVNALEEKKEYNYQKLRECKPALIAYTMFSILELVVEDPFPNQKDPTIYPRMTQRAVEEGPEADLWRIYVDEKELSGQKLSKFSYVKAKFLYLLFYQATNFVPQIIDGLTTKKSLECIRRYITSPETLNSLSSKILRDIEIYLKRMKLALEEKNKEGQTKTLDECKNAIVNEGFPPEFKSLIQKCVSEMMSAFFPHISFCNIWEKHPSPFLREVGQIISTPLNRWLNLITQLALERIVFPSILQHTLTSFIQDKKKEYIFSRGLYRTAARKMIEIRDNLDKPKAVERTSSSGVPLKVNILTRIAELATEVYLQDFSEAQEESDSFFLANFKRKFIHPLIQIGIVEGGKIALPRLYDSEVIEDLFTTLLETSLSALTQPPENYEKLVKDYEESIKELEEAKRLLFKKVHHQIIDIQLAPKAEFLEQQMQASIIQIRYELLNNITLLKKFIKPLEIALFTIERYFNKAKNQDSMEKPPEEAFQAMNKILNAFQVINECLDLNKIAKKHFQLTAEQRQKLDCALQPIREKFLQLVQVAREFNQNQNTHYLCARVYELQDKLAKRLQDIDGQLQQKETGSLAQHFFPAKKDLHDLALLSQHLMPIQEETQKSLQELYQTISRSLKTIEEEDQTIQRLKSLIEVGKDKQPSLIQQLIDSPHSADLKQTVGRILQQANIATPRFLSRIDQMILYVFSLWEGEWDRFEKFIFEQIPENQQPLRDQFAPFLAKYSKIPREGRFPIETWEADSYAFQRAAHQEDQELVSCLLSQMEAFLRTGSFRSAQWNQFCQELRLEINQRTQVRENALAIYEEGRHRLQRFQDLQLKAASQAQQEVSFELNKNLEEIHSGINEFRHLVEHIETKKSYSPIQVLTGGFMVGGAFIGGGAALVAATGLASSATIAAAVSGALASLSTLFNPKKSSITGALVGAVGGFALGSVAGPIGPILSGAAAGAHMGQEFPENAKHFGKSFITGEVNTFLRNVEGDLPKPSTKQFAIGALLE